MQDIPRDVLIEASEGDLKSFQTLYRSAADFVYNVAFRILNNREDAQEVTQDVFLIVYHKLKGFRFQASFKTWIYRITVNRALNFIRRNAWARARTTEYQDALDSGQAYNATEARIDEEHYDKVVERFLGAVNPEQRACVVLRDIEGLSYKEIAEVLKININTVRSRLKRAREKLLAARKRPSYEYL